MMEAEYWKQGFFQFLHVLYAHESRVWSSVILSSCIISVGEDSSVCFWKHDGSLIRREKCHNGGSIWCIDSNDEGTIAVTGGSDSGVLLWDVPNMVSTVPMKILPLDSTISNGTDFPRNVLLVARGSHHFVLVMTDKGGMLLYDLQQRSWVFEYKDDSFSSYCLPSVSPDNNLVLVGNLLGEVFVFLFNENELSFSHKVKICEGKVNNLHWVEPNCKFILVCGLNGNLMLWNVHHKASCVEFSKMCSFHLPKNKHHWWSTAAVLIEDTEMLVVGDRGGSIHIYPDFWENSENVIKPVCSYPYIHGRNGVTDLKIKENQLYSTGRDGKLIAYKILPRQLHKLHHIKVAYDMEWLAKIMIIDDALVLLGFHAEEFVAWSMKHGRLLTKVACGGGHRSWDFIITDDFSAVFTAVKKKEVIVVTEQLNCSINEPCVLTGAFGMPLCCMCYITSLTQANHGGTSVFACGGEDPTLKIIGLNNSGDQSSSLTVFQSMSGHLSNVRAIAICKLQSSDDDFLMVSVGGRAQMCAWKVSCFKGVACEYLNTDFLWNMDKPLRKPWKEKLEQAADPLTRYMDVALRERSYNNYFIGTACSDSFVRIHSFDLATSVFSLVNVLSQGENCILRIALLSEQNKKEPYIVTTATDGYLKVYSFPKMNDASLDDEVDSKRAVIPIFKKQFHQSGVNALDIKLISADSCLICTGGDDNAISISLWQCGSADASAYGIEKNAHASQIAGVRILHENLILSVSIDQRLNLWQWKQLGTSLKLVLLQSKLTYVADVSNLEMFSRNSSEDLLAVVCGEGLEAFSIKFEDSNVF